MRISKKKQRTMEIEAATIAAEALRAIAEELARFNDTADRFDMPGDKMVDLQEEVGE